MSRIVFLWAIVMVFLSGCAHTERKDYTAFYAHRPRSIVVVPVLNQTAEITAPYAFISTITSPLAEHGYYVFPVYLTDGLLSDIGLTEALDIHQLPPSKFADLFGADAVLFVTIEDWSKSYIVINASGTVRMKYELIDTRTGLSLWQGEQKATYSETGLLTAAIAASMDSNEALARQANYMVLMPPNGLPAGPYNPAYQNDKDKY
jgi:hypothetical protein